MSVKPMTTGIVDRQIQGETDRDVRTHAHTHAEFVEDSFANNIKLIAITNENIISSSHRAIAYHISNFK